MPRAKRRVEEEVEEEDSDSDFSTKAARAQQRIFELKRERDAQIAQVVAETEAALARAQFKFEAAQKKEQKAAAERRIEHVDRLIENLERRRDVEGRIVEEAHAAHREMCELEEIMLKGIQGREADVSKCLPEGFAGSASKVRTKRRHG